MQALEDRDYFTDHSILKDPYAYFEAIRARGPVYRVPSSGVVIVTGFEETLEVLANTRDFSSANAPQGAAVPLPFAPQGADITPQIETNRLQFIGGNSLVAYDDTQHSQSRALLARLFTPSRLKASEQFIAEYSDELIGDAVARGGCELIKEIATPFVTMVIADLLGVPMEDRKIFMDVIDASPPPGSLSGRDRELQGLPLAVMGAYFAEYVFDRRKQPRSDILSELSNAKYPDGTTPDAMEIVRLTTFLFGAGQDTSAKLLGNSMKYIVDEPGLQDRLRKDPGLITALLEEILRLEGSSKITSRLARKDTHIAGIDIPAGTRVLLALAAANRDPRRWENPQQVILDRPRSKEHVAFGRGAHVCAGAPLARAEVKIILEKFLQHTSRIDLADAQHGAAGQRNFDYEASFIIRGLSELHLKLTPAASHTARAPRARLLGDAPVASTRYSTSETKLSDLLANAETKAVIDKYFPAVNTDRRMTITKCMTLRGIQKFAPELFNADAFKAADAELAGLRVRAS